MIKHLTLLWILLQVTHLHAQDSLRRPPVIVKPAYLKEMQANRAKKTRPADTLQQELIQLRLQNDSLLGLINDELVRSRTVEQQNALLDEEIKKLESELNAAKGEQLQTSHTSSVLLVFNILAGIILLVALVWIFTRRKGGSESVPDTAIRTINNIPASADPVETRLERIEKLGRLRDKGLLTEDEFQMQKKQLLG
jgi:hypothetical protein